MNIAPTSLRARLSGILGLLFLGGMIILYLAANSYARLAADRSYDRLLSGSALSIAETLSVAGGEVDVDIPYAALDMLSAAPEDRVFYRVVGPDGTSVTGYDDLPQAVLPRRRGRDAALDQPVFFDATYRGEPVRFVTLDREIAQSPLSGHVQVQVGQTRRARAALARELVIGAILPIAVMTIVALAVVWFGIALALRPLTRLGSELANRAHDDLTPIADEGPREIAAVVSALNAFMLRLGNNIHILRGFVADAAHQIRTPLAAIMTRVELAEQENEPEMRDSIGMIRRSGSRLTRLVNQLLSDATVHHRSDVRSFEVFDLLAIVRDTVSDIVPQSEDSDVRFRTSLDSAPFYGDAVMIGEAVKNLIHNALIHGRADHAEATIELSILDDGYCFTVSDRGPGFPAADRARLFERFARGRTEVSGAGLGLAIARQAAEAHRGHVRLEDREDGGARVVLFLRAAA